MQILKNRERLMGPLEKCDELIISFRFTFTFEQILQKIHSNIIFKIKLGHNKELNLEYIVV